MHKLEILMIDPERLKPYFRNPRDNDKTVQALLKIIPRIGFNVPIVVDKDLVIIKGHARWNTARLLELKEVPIIISEATDEQNNKDRILDNAIHELTLWDYDKLKVEIDETGIDLSQYNLSWIKKISEVTGSTKEQKEIILTFMCPKCKGEISMAKKEILK